jgi:hypothetical protein
MSDNGLFVVDFNQKIPRFFSSSSSPYIAETTSSSNDQTENETKSDLDVNTSTPIRLFGQFKPNGFGFNNLSPSIFGQNTFKEKTDDQNSSSTYFTNSLSKLSSTNTTGFGSSSTPLAASLASLGAK